MRLSFVLAVVVLIAGLPHLTCFVGAYVFDDFFVIEAPEFEDLSAGRWWSLTNRPVGQLSFAIQFATLGRSTIASHCVNLVVHLLCVFGLGLLLDLLLRLISRDQQLEMRHGLVAISTALWAVHPLTTSTVTYVIQRYESLASLGMIWSCFFWLAAYTTSDKDQLHVNDKPRPALWITCLFAAAFAFGSKETAAGLPFILLLLDRVALRSSWRSTVRHAAMFIVLLIPILAGLWLRLPGLLTQDDRFSTVGFRLHGIDAIQYVLSQPFVYLRYLKLLLLPTDMVLDYGWIPSRFAGWHWFGAVGWVCILSAVAWTWKRNRVIAWALTSTLLVLATTSLIPTQDLIFEHRFYLPSAIIICTLVVGLGNVLSDRLDHTQRWLLVGVTGTMLVFGTVMRNLDYVSAEQLVRVDVRRQSENPRSVYQLGYLTRERDPAQFEAAIRRAIELSEDRGYFYAGTNYKWPRDLADLLFFQGRFDEAEHWYLSALAEKHSDLQEAEVLLSLAVIASRKQQSEKANQCFERALSLDTQIQSDIRAAYDAHLANGRRTD